MKPIRFAIVGTNFISDLFCDAVRRTPGCEIGAIYSRSDTSGTAFAAKNGLTVPVFTDYGTMLSADLDAVYIASPHFCHMEQSIAAMAAGKHVLVEKSAALNAAQFSAMKEAAEKHHVVLCEAMRPWFDPSLRVIRESLGRCGKLRHARFEFCQYSSRYDRFLGGEVLNAFDPSLSNCALLDIGIYCAANALYLFGAPADVTARSVFLHNGFEAGGTATLLYDGFTAELCYSKVFQSDCLCRIDGEGGAVTYTLPSVPHGAVFSKRVGRDHKEEKIPLPTVENNMVYELAAFCSFAAGDGDESREKSEIGAAESLALTSETISLLDRIRGSAGIDLPGVRN